MVSRFAHCSLARRNTFGMDVSCRELVEVDREEDLLELDWDALPRPLLVMGGGSNLLFTRDFPGTVVHFAGKGMRRDGERVHCGAGVAFDDFCAAMAEEGLWGSENLSLIPGECGASVVQNIGAYGMEVGSLVEGIRALDLAARRVVEIDPATCGYGYRTSRFKTDWKGRYLVVSVTYRLSREPRPVLDYGGVREALARMGVAEGTLPSPLQVRQAVSDIRRAKLPDPAKVGSAGSFFCNPVLDAEAFDALVARVGQEEPGVEIPHFPTPEGGVKVPAAWLIARCGLKGRCVGGAQVHPAQPLVLANATGRATPQDVLSLEAEVKDAVWRRYGVALHPEVEHI